MPVMYSLGVDRQLEERSLTSEHSRLSHVACTLFKCMCVQYCRSLLLSHSCELGLDSQATVVGNSHTHTHSPITHAPL